MKNLFRTLLAGIAALTLGATVLVLPSAAMAADNTPPTGTVADWSYTAPWAAGSGNGGDCVGPTGVGTRGLWDAAVSSCAIPVTGVVPAISPDLIAEYLGLGFGRTTGGWVGSLDAGGTAFAAVNFRLPSASPSFTLNLVEQFPSLGLTGRFYAENGDRATGTASGLTTLRGFPFTVTGVQNGVRVNTVMSAPSNPWESHVFTVVGERTDGTRIKIGVAVGSLDYGGLPLVAGLSYTVPVGETLTISKADLVEAATFHSGVDADVVIDALPASVTASADGQTFSFVSEEPVVERFDYRAEEIQAPMTNRVSSDAATVTITAVEGEVTEPPVVEPPVTEPPVVEPPVTEPPAVEPPVVEPPVVTPPAEREIPEAIKTGDGPQWLVFALLTALVAAFPGVLAVKRRAARR